MLSLRGFSLVFALGILLGFEPAAAAEWSVQGDTLINHFWGFEITVPKHKPYEQPSQTDARLILAAQSAPTHRPEEIVRVSALLEEREIPVSADECVRTFSQKKEGNLGKLVRVSRGGPTYRLYEKTIEEGGKPIVQKDLFAYWVREKHCIELQVSNRGGTPDMEKRMLNIMESFKLYPRAPGTLEIASAALADGADPTSPAPFADKAREAMNRGGSGDRQKALAYYLTALELNAQQPDLDASRRRDIYYDVAALYAVRKETALALKYLKWHMTLVPKNPGETQRALAQIQNDVALSPVRSDPAYQEWISQFEP